MTLHKSLPALVAAILGTALSGCFHEKMDQMTQAVEGGERPVALAGSGTFFDGKIVVRVTIARGIGHGYHREKPTLTSPGTGFDAARERREQDRANEQQAKEAYEDYGKVHGIIATPLPPVTLHLILINTTKEALTVSATDFESELGNFVVYPETLTVPANDTAEPTPMVSQLGVTSSEIPFTVELRLGKERSRQVIVVKNLLDENGRPKPSE
jgi:hypothetical protein